jgi:hypothetical protein
LQEQLLARESKLNSREGAIAVWEDRLIGFECALGSVRTECDAKCVQAKAVQQDFLVRMRASSSMSKQLTNLNRMLEECQIVLFL